MLAFWGTLQREWALFGRPLLRGDLSASELLGAVPLADPFAVLQIVLTGRIPGSTVLLGAVLVLLFYAALGGRTFCSWVCPVNPVTDLAAWLRRRFDLQAGPRIPRRMRDGALGLSLVLCPLTGLAAFEWISPIGILHRGLIFGIGAGWLVVGALFLLDLGSGRAWCGRLFPLGAFWGRVGTVAQLRIGFEAESCTRCGDCFPVCPEPQVLDLRRAARRGFVSSGNCTNCGRCIPACPEGSLAFAWRTGAARKAGGASVDRGRRAA
jgi:ferredoxin-type protein NapH